MSFDIKPGVVALLGSGETAPGSYPIYNEVLGRLKGPIRIDVLETPAGFELNSERVAGRVAEFLQRHLRNYRPEVTLIPARKRGTPYSPDDPAVVAPLLRASAIFLGPGSPTYAVRQLQGSLAWQIVQARHRLGAALIAASAAVVALGTYALPVYEIYKVGADPFWYPGLDYFRPFGLRLVLVPHWDNREGGDELDTSRCWMGRARFERLLALLPPDLTVVGIDEHSALILDCEAGRCQVMGRGGVTLLQRTGEGVWAEERFGSGESFAFEKLGACHFPEAEDGIAPEVWAQVLAAQEEAEAVLEPSGAVRALVDEREAARARRDWAEADLLRHRVAELGWQINDTPRGPVLIPLDPKR